MTYTQDDLPTFTRIHRPKHHAKTRHPDTAKPKSKRPWRVHRRATRTVWED